MVFLIIAQRSLLFLLICCLFQQLIYIQFRSGVLCIYLWITFVRIEIDVHHYDISFIQCEEQCEKQCAHSDIGYFQLENFTKHRAWNIKTGFDYKESTSWRVFFSRIFLSLLFVLLIIRRVEYHWLLCYFYPNNKGVCVCVHRVSLIFADSFFASSLFHPLCW